MYKFPQATVDAIRSRISRRASDISDKVAQAVLTKSKDIVNGDNVQILLKNTSNAYNKIKKAKNALALGAAAYAIHKGMHVDDIW